MKTFSLSAAALLAASTVAIAPAMAQTAPQTVAYTNVGAQTGGAAGSGLNIGRTFTVGGNGILVSSLGIYDDGSNGLANSHDVTLFSLLGGAPVALFGVNVAAGNVATLVSGFRFTDLATPQFLGAGNYALIGYGLSSDGDPYGDFGGLPVSSTGVTDGGFDPFQFNAGSSPSYPTGGDNRNHSSVSFQYAAATGAVPEPATWAMMVLGFGMVGFGLRRRAKSAVRVTYA